MFRRKKSQCNAFVDRTGKRCTKSAYGKYCWHHTPKSGVILLNIIVFVFTFVCTLVFSEPAKDILCKIPFLKYLDKDEPIVYQIIPNLNAPPPKEKINKITLKVKDRYSGLDLDKSSFVIKKKITDHYETVDGQQKKSEQTLSFIPSNELEYGEYLLEAMLIDKAENKAPEFIKKFSLQEQVLDISHEVVKYDNYDNKLRFADVFKDTALKNYFDFYICNLKIRNKAANTNVVRFSMTIYFPGFVLSWKKNEDYRVKDPKDTQYSEIFPKEKKPKELVYMLQNFQVLDISQISPTGFYSSTILFGKPKSSMPSKACNKSTSVSGIYIAEGQGTSEPRKFGEKQNEAFYIISSLPNFLR